MNIGLSLYTGSLTTYTNRNPSFSVVELDQEYMIPVSYKTYYLDIEKANTDNAANWAILHDLKQEYLLEDLSPDTIQTALAEVLLANETAALNYLWNKNKKTPAREPTGGCDSWCR